MRQLIILLLSAHVVFADSPAVELTAGKDPAKKYLLVGDTGAKPKGGFGLVVVMPGGDGSKEFAPFVNTLHAEAMPKGFLVVQPYSVKFTDAQEIVWPTAASKGNVAKCRFTTEEFIDAIFTDVMAAHTIDPKKVFTLSWSSSGPAAYALSVANPKITGSLVAMSVFFEKDIDATQAKGKNYFLYHSPDDRICRYNHATKAKEVLTKNGATVTLVDYDGGHGWQGATMDDVRTGIDWLVNKNK